MENKKEKLEREELDQSYRAEYKKKESAYKKGEGVEETVERLKKKREND